MTIMGDSYESWRAGEAEIREACKQADLIGTKDVQIGRLVTALQEIKNMTVCNALGDRFARAQQVAIVALRDFNSRGRA